MIIRSMTNGDADAVHGMAQRFLSSDGPYKGRYAVDSQRLVALLSQMVNSPESITLVAMDGETPHGMFAMFCFDHPITGDRVASELCWWMDPECRGGLAALRMLRTGEDWARAKGARMVEMIAPNERVAGFYDRIGYQRTDVHYTRKL